MKTKAIKKLKRITAFIMCIAMITTSFNGVTLANTEDATNATEEHDFGYVMYATAYEEGAITIDAYSTCINGDLMTNGTVEITGNSNHNGQVKISQNESNYIIHEKINNNYFANEYDLYEEDKTIQESNINLNTAIMVQGNLELIGNINLNTQVQAMDDVNISGDTINANNAVIMSKNGDININTSNVSMTGLIYAPFGTVNIESSNCNLNSVIIIANQINIKCGNLNANYNSYIGKIIGNQSEEYICDEEEVTETKDTDGDGLNDYYETYYTFTDYLNADTDGDGVNDYEEDSDYDLLTNGEELGCKTHPLCEDTDDDGLSDYEEIYTYGSDPLVEDTDGDSLIESDEIAIGTSVTDVDTDDDGITDDKEMFQQEVILENEDYVIEEVSVEMECTGRIDSTTIIEETLNINVITSQVPGLVGSPYEITTNSRFSEAKISFKVSEDYLENNSLQKLVILWYDEANEQFVIMDTEHDLENALVSTTTTHFSEYMLVDSEKLYTALTKEVNYDYNLAEKKTVNNTVLLFDCSSNMRGLDPVYQETDTKYNMCNRIKAGHRFLEFKGANDKMAIVMYSDEPYTAMKMTSNSLYLKNAMYFMRDRGIIDYDFAMQCAINEFGEEELNNENANNQIVFLSAGTNICSYSVWKQAIEKDIKLHTITMGDYRSQNIILKVMAETTGGEYIEVTTPQELIEAYEKIGTLGMDFKDSDKDDIPDIYEINGMVLRNGDIIYTDAENPDTDGDGLLDGQEIYPTPIEIPKEFLKELAKCFGKELSEEEYNENMYWFIMRSNPRRTDTDGDGYNDFKEYYTFQTSRVISDVKEYGLEDDYICVKYEGSENWVNLDNRNVSYGGNPGWFYDKDIDWGIKRIQDSGCGLISVADILLYLSKQDEEYCSEYTDYAEMDERNMYSFISYFEYVCRLSSGYFYVPESGLDDYYTSKGYNEYFKDNDMPFKASWCASTEKVLPRVKEMLKNDIPVTFSLEDWFSEDESIDFYKKDGNNYIIYGEQKFQNHYVTITGLIEDKISGEKWFRVSTWGYELYVSYNEYMEFVNKGNLRNFSSNIIYIKETK